MCEKFFLKKRKIDNDFHVVLFGEPFFLWPPSKLNTRIKALLKIVSVWFVAAARKIKSSFHIFGTICESGVSGMLTSWTLVMKLIWRFIYTAQQYTHNHKL